MSASCTQWHEGRERLRPTVCVNIQLEKEHPITYDKTAETSNSYRILAVKPIVNAPLEDREGDGRVMLKWILGR
jgi:hypothetical protein